MGEEEESGLVTADTLAAAAPLDDTLERELAAALGDGIAATTSALAPGTVVGGKYRIIAALGRGGMGRVYRATHVDTGGEVAVKVLLDQEAASPDAAKRFRREAQNAASLSHANTVRVTDFGEDGGQLYLVMELVDGEALDGLLRREGALPWRRVTAIAAQVLKALWEAHDHPRTIIHRDIKPANILVSQQPGQPDFVKVADFGISRALTEGTEQLTQGVLGSPLTMSPEQWLSETIDPRTDLYSLGCTAYQMLAGRPVFNATSAMSMGHYHLHEEPVPLRDLAAADTPAPLVAWVERMMAKQRDDRFASAKEALEALQAVSANPEAAVDAAPAARMPRHYLVGAALVIGVAAILLAWPLPKPADPESVGAQPEPIAGDASSTTPAPKPAGLEAQPPIRRRCTDEGALATCTDKDHHAWCGASDTKPIACCAEGMVPAPDGDGICMCAPGGTRHAAAARSGCQLLPSDAAADAARRKAVGATVRRRMKAIKACYERGLAKNAQRPPQGKVVVSWQVGPLGRVYGARVKQASFPDPTVQRCVLDVVDAIRFKPPLDGWMRITYPFILKTK